MPNNNNLVSHKNTNIYLPNTNMIHKYKNVFTRQKKVFVCTVIGCGAPHHQRRRKKEFERARSVGVALASSVVSVSSVAIAPFIAFSASSSSSSQVNPLGICLALLDPLLCFLQFGFIPSLSAYQSAPAARIGVRF